MRFAVQPWDSVVARLDVIAAGAGVAGLAPTVAIQRLSDAQWLAAGGGAWGAGFAVNNMVAIDAVNQPGMYEYAIPGAQLSYPVSRAGYRLKYAEATTPITEFEYLVPRAVFQGELAAGLATAGGAATVTFAAWAPGVAGQFIDCLVTIISGTGSGQAKSIIGYSGGRLATVSSPWVVVPDATSVCVVTGAGQVNLGRWLGSAVQSPTASGNIKVDVEEWRAAVPGALNGGFVGADLNMWRGAVPANLNGVNVQVDVETWRNVPPNNLVGGRVDADVGGIQNGPRDATAGAVWDAQRGVHGGAGTFGEGVKLYQLTPVVAGATSWTEIGHAVWRRNATTGAFGASPTGAEPDWTAAGALQPEWWGTILMSLVGATVRGGSDTPIQVADNAHAGGTRFYVGPGAYPDGAATEWVGTYAVYVPAGASGKRPLDGSGNGGRATTLVRVTGVGVDGTGNFIDVEVATAIPETPLGNGGIAVGDWLIGIHSQSVGAAIDTWSAHLETFLGGLVGGMLPTTTPRVQASMAGVLSVITEAASQGFRDGTNSQWVNPFVATGGTVAKFYYTSTAGPTVLQSPIWAGKSAVLVTALTGVRCLVRVGSVSTDGAVYFALTLPDGTALPGAVAAGDRLIVLQNSSASVNDIMTASMAAYETAGTFGNHINRMLRLRQENMRVVYTAWSTHGQPTDGYVLLYASSSDLTTDTGPAWALAKGRYDFTATYNGDLQLTGYQSTRTL